MTSDRQRQANRANAARSTGPKSRAGKAASSGNARLHGLATPLARVAGADAEIRQLAEAIAKDVGRLDLIDLAARIAEAELDLRRIARVRQAEKEVAKRPPPREGNSFATSDGGRLYMMARDVTRLRRQAASGNWAGAARCLGWDPDGSLPPDPFFEWARDRAQSDALERYERRALSRRKTAIRDFDRARCEPPLER